MDVAVEDGIGNGGLPDHSWPAFYRNLTGDEDGLSSVALLDELEQVASALEGEAPQPPVVEDEQGDPGEAAHQALVASALALGDAAIEHRVLLSAGLMGEVRKPGRSFPIRSDLPRSS